MSGCIRGATPSAVKSALEQGAALSGLDGFAGQLPDGRLVRDVLGREPLFHDPSADSWAFTPHELSAPNPVPAGTVVEVRSTESKQVFTLPDATPASRTEAIETVHTAVAERLAELGDIPVAFSGGLDSGLVATGSDGPLYVVGFPDSPDVRTAKAAAAELDRDLTVIELTVDQLETLVPTVATAINRTDAMSVAIALPFYVLGDTLADAGYQSVAIGQGADELFAGYEKFIDPANDDRVEASTTLAARNTALSSIATQVERDVLAFQSAGVRPITPLLSDNVVKAALTVPPALLATESARKRVLRIVARDRLPTPIATREKRAVQYGTLTARELDRLARDAGFKRRIGDHVSKYITHRVEEDDSHTEP